MPGGPGVNAVLEDSDLLDFLRQQAPNARYVTSASTGAAGLLEGYAVTTHWASFDNLALFGARPVQRRVVVDRNRVTAGGATGPAASSAGSISACCGDPERTGDRAGDPVDD